MNKNVLLLDGYNLFYRARYSGMNKGEYSTIFNFFRSLRPLIEKFSPDKVYLVLEGMPKKRLDILPDYKGQRVYSNEDNFSSQRKEIIKIIAEYFPICLVKHDDYECDDIIGYLTVKNKKENNKVTIVSSDTDFIQLISDSVDLYNPVQKKFIDKFTCDYVTWKALKGDNSDNIQGFKGIGDKRAKTLIEDSDKLKAFLSEGNNKEKFYKNVELIRLHDLEEDNEVENIKYFDVPANNKWNELKQLFVNEYNFNSMVKTEKSWTNYTKTFDNLFRS